MRSEVKNLPEKFLARLQKIIPSQKFDNIANTFAMEKPTTFRVNTLKRPVQEVREKLQSSGFRLESVAWYPDAFILRDGRLRDLQETDIYKKGEIYVQSLPSMVPPLVLDPQPGEKILDLTAAPGSKTTQIACLMKAQGRLLANDNNKVRFYRMKANVELQGASFVELSLRYGEIFGREYPNQFDRVLLDAPCSAEGRFEAKDPSTFGYWKPAKVHEMAQKQKKLMYSAVSALRAGGILVYSTCTYAPEENEGILDWALSKFPDQMELENISFSLPNQMAGLGTWDEKTFHPSVRKSVRILPNAQMEGFFVARLRKK
jgi:NOL1/NOP2/sun family putative RNA methylase